MPRRFSYIGDAGVAGTQAFSVPVQTEAIAFFNRFSTSPSQAVQNAINRAIYRWKQDSVWAQISDLFLFCTDTSADSLRNLMSASRDASLVNSPTFTARKGFTGTGSAGVSAPFSGSITTSDFAFFGGIVDASGGGGVIVGTGTNYVGAIKVVGSGWGMGTASNPGIYGTTSSQPGVTAFVTSVPVTAAGQVAASGGSTAGLTANPMSLVSAALPRITTYGFLLSTTTKAQAQLFLSTLQACLDELGALS